ncbi:Heat shock factor binding 1 [Kalmanozyma brasiliensis GHG001]|uniref:Heat shock factor binding protein 1 n=1 Tax=Kalmanozyma brasiliensis (strain GHG001) TaxID=1365824 RepID=V5GNC9_KALBG|nr:Heat shock factor binding 1 [Kalmanozyma brasiliensis GHG001]EST07467.1 Heat shock factor binding 1 [Kalmanozyma brasiliensis GHG001]
MSAATLAPTPASQPSTSSAASASSHIDNAGATTEKEGLQAPDISSPHQLIDWVDTVLGQLETRFDDMNGQVTARMNEMSSRIDALESSIQDLIHGTLAPAGASTPNDA